MKKLSTILAIFLFVAPVLAQNVAQPSPEKVELARRMLGSMKSAEGSVAVEQEQTMLQYGTRSDFAAAPEIFAAALRKALEVHAAEIAAAQERRVQIYAQFYTEQDLIATLQYLESPLGRSIQDKDNELKRKQAAARSSGVRSTTLLAPPGSISTELVPLLTSEEKSALYAYAKGPAEAMRFRWLNAARESMMANGQLGANIYRTAAEDFCSKAACSKITLDTLKQPDKK